MSEETLAPPGPLTKEQQRWVLEALPEIERAAAAICRRFPRAEIADMIGVGRLEASSMARTFDPRRLPRFWLYAVKAVRGAMIDAAGVQCGLTQAERRILAGMVAGVPELREQEGGDQGSLPARVRAAEENQDAIGMGVVLGAAYGLSNDPETVLAQKRLRADLADALQRSTAEQQRIVEMHYRERVPLAEVGKALGMGRTTIKARHRALLVRLRTLLEAWS